MGGGQRSCGSRGVGRDIRGGCPGHLRAGRMIRESGVAPDPPPEDPVWRDRGDGGRAAAVERLVVCIFTNRMRRLDLAGGECGGLIVGVAADLRRGRLGDCAGVIWSWPGPVCRRAGGGRVDCGRRPRRCACLAPEQLQGTGLRVACRFAGRPDPGAGERAVRALFRGIGTALIGARRAAATCGPHRAGPLGSRGSWGRGLTGVRFSFRI